jgi:hypothetical protein
VLVGSTSSRLRYHSMLPYCNALCCHSAIPHGVMEIGSKLPVPTVMEMTLSDRIKPAQQPRQLARQLYRPFNLRSAAGSLARHVSVPYFALRHSVYLSSFFCGHALFFNMKGDKKSSSESHPNRSRRRVLQHRTRRARGHVPCRTELYIGGLLTSSLAASQTS